MFKSKSLERVPVNSFWVFIVGYSFAFIFAIYSSIYAYHKLGQPGISVEVRSLVLSRHIIAIILYTICNSYVIATAIVVVMNGGANAATVYKPWKIFLKILFFS